LSDRFAKLVLEELAEIHGLVQCLVEKAASDVAADPEKPVHEETLEKMMQAYISKSRSYASDIYKHLLELLKLND
jgi:hypothetical protein